MAEQFSHRGNKILEADFNSLWERISNIKEILLITPQGHKFSVVAETSKRGIHSSEKFLKIKHNSKEFARIHACCWGHTTNCYGTRIGGYSEALNSWYMGFVINVDSITLKPKKEILEDFGTLFKTPLQPVFLTRTMIPEKPGVYIIYDYKQKKYIYVGSSENIKNSLVQQLRLQKDKSNFYLQPVQKGLILNKRCTNSKEAKAYIISNCGIKILIIPEEKTRKIPSMRRILLKNYAVSVLEPEYNFLSD